MSFYVDFQDLRSYIFIVDYFVVRRIFMKDTKVDAGDNKKLFVSRWIEYWRILIEDATIVYFLLDGSSSNFGIDSLSLSAVPEISFNYGHGVVPCNCRERLTRATCVRQFTMVVTARDSLCVGTVNDKQQDPGCLCFSAHATANKRQNVVIRMKLKRGINGVG